MDQLRQVSQQLCNSSNRVSFLFELDRLNREARRVLRHHLPPLSHTSWNHLGADLLRYLLTFLLPRDAGSAKTTCRSWGGLRATLYNSLWQTSLLWKPPCVLKEQESLAVAASTVNTLTTERTEHTDRAWRFLTACGGASELHYYGSCGFKAIPSLRIDMVASCGSRLLVVTCPPPVDLGRGVDGEGDDSDAEEME